MTDYIRSVPEEKTIQRGERQRPDRLRTEGDGYIVATVQADDGVWETGLIQNPSAPPRTVARYRSRAEAVAGHQSFVTRMEANNKEDIPDVVLKRLEVTR